jgi:hypothetical protein
MGHHSEDAWDPDFRSYITETIGRKFATLDPAARLLPGAFQQNLFNVAIDPKLPPDERLLALAHESAHMVLSEHHWGEMIRRLEQIAIILFTFTSNLRGMYIYEIFDVAGPELRDSMELRAAFLADPGVREIIAAKLRSSRYLSRRPV